MKYWIDSHAHIYLKEFDHDRAEVLRRSDEHNVQKIYMPNIDHTSIDNMLEVEAKNPEQCISMMGLHPCSVNKDFEKELYHVESWLSKRTFAAVGEIGTDLYWDKTYWEQQKEAFNIQVKWARQYELPIVIHCRDSIDQTIDLVEALHDDKLKGVFHCFTGTQEQAKRITQLGFYLGIGGVSTFKNGGMDTVIPELDVSTILLETDSPYLSPVPHRGKRNEPAYIPIIAERVADLKKITLEELQLATSTNAQNLFSK
ncbi:MAG TPA: TatD family hydrolase [Cyclobacteriaceae bacterium]|nr:TatD family hydrolase [Cyclobacteriaceae bacterium]HRK53304.1 TatD family hydrolase [Cyclobacteriaceae bacterium]